MLKNLYFEQCALSLAISVRLSLTVTDTVSSSVVHLPLSLFTPYQIAFTYFLFYCQCICFSSFMTFMNSVVGTATSYGLGERGVGVQVPVGSRIFCSPRRPDLLWGPPNLLSNGYRWFFPGVKRQGRETDHSPPANAEVKKMLFYTPIPPYAFMTKLTKLRGLSPQTNYTDRATAAVGEVMPTFADRGVLRGQRNGSPRPLISIF
jgi:hypothetical protein